MKVEIKINNDTLIATNEILQRCYSLNKPVEVSARNTLSIAYDLADKFDSKCRQKIKKANLFDNSKKFKMTLKYHEATALHTMLIASSFFTENEYKATLISQLISQINQKIV